MALLGKVQQPGATHPGRAQDELVDALRRVDVQLRELRAAPGAGEPLPVPLIHYVFFPLSQLLRLRDDGLYALGDRVRELVFSVLALLAEDWWHAWTWSAISSAHPGTATRAAGALRLSDVPEWSVWEQLLLLGSMAAGAAAPADPGTPPTRRQHTPSSDATRLAIARFLVALLAPRSAPSAPSSDAPWEWDGVSDLPSLDDMELDAPGAPTAPSQLYPARQHRDAALQNPPCSGALAHMLKLALDTSAAPESDPALRAAMLDVAAVAALGWLGSVEGAVFTTDQSLRLDVDAAATAHTLATRESAKQASATRLAPVLPGITSALVRLVTGRNAPPGTRPPGPLVARALDLLAVVLLTCTADDVTTVQRENPTAPAPAPAPARLEDFAALVPQEDVELGDRAPETGESEPDTARSDADTLASDPGTPLASGPATPATSVADEWPAPPAGAPAVRDRTWLRSTMRMVLLSLAALEPLSASPSAPVQHALVRLAHALLQAAPETLAWSWDVWMDGHDDPRHPHRQMLRALLDAAAPTQPEGVVAHAAAAVESLLAPTAAPSAPPSAAAWLRLLDAELAHAADAIPAAVRQVRDEQVQVLARRGAAAAALLAYGAEARRAQLAHPELGVLRLLGPSGGVEHWGAALAVAVALDASAAPAEVHVAPDDLPGMRLRPALARLESGSGTALGTFLGTCGEALGSLVSSAAAIGGAAAPPSKAVFHAPLFLLQEGGGGGLWAADELLAGVQAVLGAADAQALLERRDGRTLRRLVHALGRSAAGAVLDRWEQEREREADADLWDAAPAEPAEQAVQRAGDADETQMVRGLASDDAGSDDAALAMRMGSAVNLEFVEHANLGTPRGRAPSGAAVARAARRAAALQELGDVQRLSVLASAACLLGTSFRPLLLQALYPTLSALGSPSAAVQDAARFALARIAHACAYPSVQSCVLHHADYVLGAASHRLLAGLSAELVAGIERGQMTQAVHAVRRGSDNEAPALLSARTAPWVLVQVIRMLGAAALPLVEDAVDEVLEALDRFHGYPDVCAGLLAVLAQLLSTLAAEQEATVPEPLVQKTAAPPEDAVAAFRTWAKQRAEPEPEERGADDGPPGADAGLPGADARPPDTEPPSAAADRPSSPVNPPPTHTQTVVVSILRRCIPFLSHASAYVRACALETLADGVRVLAPQQRDADLYPVLHQAWPILLARLGVGATSRPSTRFRHGALATEAKLREAVPSEQDANVWMHAAALVAAIGTYAADAFGRPIIQQAWPRLARLLLVLDASRAGARAPERALPALGARPESVLAPRPAGGARQPRVLEEHATYTQVLLHVLRALHATIAQLGEQVESSALWDMCTHPVLLNALDARQPARVRDAALGLFRSLARSDANAVWLVLRGVSCGAPLPFLRQPGLQLSTALGTIWA